MKILLITLVIFLNSLLYANIDTNKLAITIGLSNTLIQAKQIANKLSDNDIYIYKTTTTKKQYYVIYAVNIDVSNFAYTINKIKQQYKDAYRTTKNRRIKLKLNHFDKNIFIHKRYKRDLNDIDIELYSVLVFYANSKEQLYSFIQTHRQYDLFIQNIKNNSIIYYDRCCAVYIVNLNTTQYNMIQKDRYNYPNQKKISSTKLKYLNSQHNLSKYIKHMK